MTAFQISNDWSHIETDGPFHCVLCMDGFPSLPFSSGTFQHAFKASCVGADKYLDVHTSYILKQHKLDSLGLSASSNMDNLSPEDIDMVDKESERTSAKVNILIRCVLTLCKVLTL